MFHPCVGSLSSCLMNLFYQPSKQICETSHEGLDLPLGTATASELFRDSWLGPLIFSWSPHFCWWFPAYPQTTLGFFPFDITSLEGTWILDEPIQVTSAMALQPRKEVLRGRQRSSSAAGVGWVGLTWEAPEDRNMDLLKIVDAKTGATLLHESDGKMKNPSPLKGPKHVELLNYGFRGVSNIRGTGLLFHGNSS